MANQTLWVSNNYSTGTPVNASWTQVQIPTMPTGNNWTFVNSGSVVVPQNMLTSNTRFAFKYLSNSTVAATWEMKNFNLNGQCIVSSVNNETLNPEAVVSVHGRTIRVESTVEIPVRIYDISGRVLHTVSSVAKFEYSATHKGVYLVVCANKVHKVMVR